MTETVQKTEASALLMAPASEVWALIGDFGALAQWHPWVPGCELSADGAERVIRADGEVIAVERLLSSTPLSHTYTVTEGPLPMADYRATLGVTPRPIGCRVSYRGEFVVTDPSADVVSRLQRFFEVGFEALATRFRT